MNIQLKPSTENQEIKVEIAGLGSWTLTYSDSEVTTTIKSNRGDLIDSNNHKAFDLAFDYLEEVNEKIGQSVALTEDDEKTVLDCYLKGLSTTDCANVIMGVDLHSIEGIEPVVSNMEAFADEYFERPFLTLAETDQAQLTENMLYTLNGTTYMATKAYGGSMVLAPLIEALQESMSKAASEFKVKT